MQRPLASVSRRPHSLFSVVRSSACRVFFRLFPGLVLVAGGTQVTDELARRCGMDAGFGRGSGGRQVASFLVRKLRQMDQ